MTPSERKSKIKEYREALNKLVRECPHEVLSQEKDKYGEYGGASCAGCGKDFGWYCPDSPDRTCHYYDYEGKVHLINGETVPTPEECFNCVDMCIFCGDPEERK